MEKIIGRKEEIAALTALKNSPKSEFVAVYGRRRVGKTFLIRNVFDEPFSFHLTGTANVDLKTQLTNFHVAFVKANPSKAPKSRPKNWFEAFHRLTQFLETLSTPKKTIFLDELPWFDTPQSNFISGLEYFWNSWASNRSDVLLVVCGSAASWIINELIGNRGGLHNRLTERIWLQPFSLAETELYMVMGGIPYYLDNVQVNRSVAQNVDRLFFTEGGILSNEYAFLYRSLFNDYEKHTSIVEALSQKAKGLTRKEILALTQLPDGGSTTILLEELAQSGFIKRYLPFGKDKRDALYQLIDPFTLFYLSFVKDSLAEGEGAWLTQIDSPKWEAWSGYAFEYLCRYHVKSIKKHLGIGAVYAEISTWRSQAKSGGAQIDMLIDRKDRIINVCEIKFSTNPFVVTKAYADNLQNKMRVFKAETDTNKTLLLTIIAANGVAVNQYSQIYVHDTLDMNALFD
jgi:uncharacterized protein